MFYFEGTSEVMCCYFAHRDGGADGRTEGQEDRDCSDTQTHVVKTSSATDDWLWCKRTYANRSFAPNVNEQFIRTGPRSSPRRPCLPRSRLMWNINVPVGKRAKHDGVEEARWRRRPWQRRQYQRQGKRSHSEQRATGFPCGRSPSEQVSPVVVRTTRAVCD